MPSLWIAFSAGLLSALSPCMLPLWPAYLAFLAGERGGRATLMRALVFMLSFCLVFVLMGMTATALGRFLIVQRLWLERGGGAVVILLGLAQVGVLRVPWLQRDAHPVGVPARGQRLTPLLLGLSFGIGWTACVGPVLAGILVLAAQSGSVRQGGLLLMSYALGMGLPLIAVATGLQRWIAQFRRHPLAARVEVCTGALLVILGMFMITGSLSRIVGLLA